MIKKSIIQKINLPFKLSVLSLICTVFLHASTSSCESKGYGLPVEFIQSYCTCGSHNFPIHFLGLGIDLVYHFVIWFSVLYLWQDTKETWGMIKLPSHKARISSLTPLFSLPKTKAIGSVKSISYID